MLNKSFSKIFLGIVGLIAMQPLVLASAAQGTDEALREAVEQVVAEQIPSEPLGTVAPQNLTVRPVKTRRKPITRFPIGLSTPGVMDEVSSLGVLGETSIGAVEQARLSSPALATEESPNAIPDVPRPVTPDNRGLSPMSLTDQGMVPNVVVPNMVVPNVLSLQASPSAVTQDFESSVQVSPGAITEQIEKQSVEQADTVENHSFPKVVHQREQPVEIPLEPQPSSIGTIILNQLQPERSATVSIEKTQSQPQHQRYFIQSGDTLYTLSRRFDVALETLVEVNEIEDPDVIFTGNTLSINPADSMLTNSTLTNQVVSNPNQVSGLPVYAWPADGTLTSGYGWRWGRMHRGVDIAAPVGTPVRAAAAGIVESVGWNAGSYGNLVEIRHVDGSLTRYAHNHRLLVQQNQAVTQGQVIAQVGSTGHSTGPHLHFEILQPDQGSVDPLNYLAIALP